MNVRSVVSVIFCAAMVARGAQIPPFFIDSVVALGRSVVVVPGQQPAWAPEASGFFFGDPADTETDPAKHQYSIYLVTNRHVIANHDSITMRINAQRAGDPVQDLPLPLKNPDGSDAWISHPNLAIDISVIRLNPQYLLEHGLTTSFFAGDEHAADKAKLKNIEMSVGEGVFVLGFPMGLSGSAKRNYVIARRGTIARISDLLDSTAPTFLIDALVFPGNSGGPVVSVPNVNAIQGTKAQNRAYLIGVVRAYLPYEDVALSQQTGQVRMISQENSGLAEVVPVDYINETIKAFREAEAKRAPARTSGKQ
jgi:S1-C subfamily serine protease